MHVTWSFGVREMQPTDRAQTSVFIIDTFGGDVRQLTPWEMDAGDPDWSGDGSLILFSTHPLLSFDSEGPSDLYVAAARRHEDARPHVKRRGWTTRHPITMDDRRRGDHLRPSRSRRFAPQLGDERRRIVRYASPDLRRHLHPRT